MAEATIGLVLDCANPEALGPLLGIGTGLNRGSLAGMRGLWHERSLWRLFELGADCMALVPRRTIMIRAVTFEQAGGRRLIDPKSPG